MFKTKIPNPNFAGVFDIQPDELFGLINSGVSLRLVDVRRLDEYTGELGHIQGADWLLLDELPEKYTALNPSDKIVLICRSGGRSGRAAQFLLQQGFENIYNMQGGMLLWNQMGFPVVKA